MSVDQTIPLFMACTSPGNTFDTIKSIDAKLNTPLLPSSFFRQALIATAIRTDNSSLAIELIQKDPVDPPADTHNIFKSRRSSLFDDEDMPASIHAALLTGGWSNPSIKTIFIARTSGDAAGGIALFEAMKAVGFDKWLSDPMLKTNSLLSAIMSSRPAVVEYLWDTLSLDKTVTSDMLITAVEERKTGTEMLRWLLERGGDGLDVNFKRTPPPRQLGSLDRAESEMIEKETLVSTTMAPLHAAAYAGNAEAIRFLLERGADPHALNGLGKTAGAIAEKNGHKEVFEILQEAMKGTKL